MIKVVHKNQHLQYKFENIFHDMSTLLTYEKCALCKLELVSFTSVGTGSSLSIIAVKCLEFWVQFLVSPQGSKFSSQPY